MFLALKEIKRSKFRFGLLTLAVAVLAFLILFIQGLTTGLIGQFIGALEHQSATVLVYGEQARKNLEGSIVTDAQLDQIKQAVPGATVGKLGEGTFTVEVGQSTTLQDAVLFGYEHDLCANPGADGCGASAPGAPTTLSSGRFPTAQYEAVAARGFSNKGFDLGATVAVQPGGKPITIVGLADNLSYSVAPTLFVPWETYVDARKIRNPDAVAVPASVAAVIPAPGVSAEATRDQITAAVPGVEALTRSQAVKGSPGVSSVQQSLGGVVLITLLIVPIVASFFFVILTVQKTPSLTLLRAIGARKRTLVGTIAVQAALVLTVGYVVAWALAVAAGKAMSNGGVGVVLSPGVVLGIFAVLVVLCAVGLSASVWRVLKIDPLAATQSQGVLA